MMTPEKRDAWRRDYLLAAGQQPILRDMLNAAEQRGMLQVIAGQVNWPAYGVTQEDFLAWFRGGQQ
jgi:hypothetical protein